MTTLGGTDDEAAVYTGTDHSRIQRDSTTGGRDATHDGSRVSGASAGRQFSERLAERDSRPSLVVAVVGSRDYPHLNEVRDYVRKIADKYPDAVIVSGGARGVDQCAEQAAKEAGLGVISYRPYESEGEGWTILTHVHGERAATLRDEARRVPPSSATFVGAAFRRNTWIVEDAQVVVAFTTGSSGTANTIEKARRAKKKLVVHEQSVRLAA